MNTMLTGVAFQNFEQDLMAIRATERLFEIIGEATKRALNVEPDLPISDTSKIIAMRNKIAHGYDEVDVAVLWNTYKKYLPILRNEVADIFQKS